MMKRYDLLDNDKCYERIRQIRWPDGVSCPRCTSDNITRQGKDESQPEMYHPPVSVVVFFWFTIVSGGLTSVLLHCRNDKLGIMTNTRWPAGSYSLLARIETNAILTVHVQRTKE